MKYGEYLKKNMNNDWKYFYLNYNLLKDIIKNENIDEFWVIIENELNKINSFFKIIIKYEKNNKYIDNYIVLNYMGLFKLIKKYDKHLCKNRKMIFYETISKQEFYNYYIKRKREKKKTKLVIFDKDGTLINNEKIFAPWVEKIVFELNKNYGFSSNDLFKHLGYNKENKIFSGNSIVARGTNDDIRNSINNFIISSNKNFSSVDAKEIINKIWCDISFNENNVIPFGNLNDIFKKLKKKNIKIAVCTSDDRDSTLKMLNILKVKNLIDKVVCGNDDISSKPSPEPIWKICNSLDILPSETIMIGDTIADIQSGINSRCGQIYGVLSGGYSSNYLQNGDKIFNNINDAVDYITK